MEAKLRTDGTDQRVESGFIQRCFELRNRVARGDPAQFAALWRATVFAALFGYVFKLCAARDAITQALNLHLGLCFADQIIDAN